MRDGPWKLITQAKGATDGPQLFQLDDDLGESEPAVESEPESVSETVTEPGIDETLTDEISGDVVAEPEEVAENIGEAFVRLVLSACGGCFDGGR